MLDRDVFVLGDSISIQYGPYLYKMLGGRLDRKRGEKEALVDLDKPIGANGGNSSLVLEYLSSEYKKGVLYDILLVNCGLHDIRTDPANGRKQVPINEYRNHLLRIAELILTMAKDVVWVRTTDATDEIHNKEGMGFHRYHQDVVAYNEVADEIFTGHGIPLLDLYSFTRVYGKSAYYDHVHFKEEIRQLQAAFIAGYLTARFNKNLPAIHL